MDGCTRATAHRSGAGEGVKWAVVVGVDYHDPAGGHGHGRASDGDNRWYYCHYLAAVAAVAALTPFAAADFPVPSGG